MMEDDVAAVYEYLFVLVFFASIAAKRGREVAKMTRRAQIWKTLALRVYLLVDVALRWGQP